MLSLQGLEPLRYQWIKDDKRLTTATADSQELILVDVNSADSGAYYCKVRFVGVLSGLRGCI